MMYDENGNVWVEGAESPPGRFVYRRDGGVKVASFDGDGNELVVQQTWVKKEGGIKLTKERRDGWRPIRKDEYLMYVMGRYKVRFRRSVAQDWELGYLTDVVTGLSGTVRFVSLSGGIYEYCEVRCNNG